MNPRLLPSASARGAATTLRLSVTLQPDGTVGHMRFLSPAPPSLCREVFRVFSLMPALKGADGKAPGGDEPATYTFRLRLDPRAPGH